MINFQAYHEANPKTWQLFVYYSVKTKAKGFSRYSAKAIFELCRWHEGIPKGEDGFKLNNIYTADYARKLMNELPEFEGFFITRELKKSRS